MNKAKTTFDDLAEYRARVEFARETNSEDSIYNSSQRHAAVLIEQLFVSASNSAKIVARYLRHGSYGAPETLAAVENFLARPGASLEVLVEKIEGSEKNPFVARFGGRDGVSIHEGDVLVPFDFLVVDGKAYRFEADAQECVARANFNDPEMALDLERVFERIKDLKQIA